jgi:hypothetical protein
LIFFVFTFELDEYLTRSDKPYVSKIRRLSSTKSCMTSHNSAPLENGGSANVVRLLTHFFAQIWISR